FIMHTDVSENHDATKSLNAGMGNVGIGERFAEPTPMGIPPKLYRIGEVIEHSGLSRQTVHNYTMMGLLIEVRRTKGGHRLYDESVFERLSGIIALKAQHKSLAHIREYYAKLDAG
ncbi:MAG: MerR family transcriptional regulator, partial [Phycisphaerae bacterium]|nr:MerR family transcriptional regulator [Phycisphaerae bacterium]